MSVATSKNRVSHKRGRVLATLLASPLGWVMQSGLLVMLFMILMLFASGRI